MYGVDGGIGGWVGVCLLLMGACQRDGSAKERKKMTDHVRKEQVCERIMKTGSNSKGSWNQSFPSNQLQVLLCLIALSLSLSLSLSLLCHLLVLRYKAPDATTTYPQ